jgi:N-acyl-phosphatidylethanolamine-hydrolysing phospholipase D
MIAQEKKKLARGIAIVGAGMSALCNGLYGFQMHKALAIITSSFFLLTCAAPPHHQDKPHHTKKGFKNVYSYEEPGFVDFLKWRWSRLWKETPKPDDYHFPLANNDPAFLGANREITTLTWIGHATVLFQLEGNNILTDPHFSERASPVQWVGPRRVVPPGLALKDLPPIDIVVISHDHYDSLDTQSIVKLYEREGGKETTFFVPLGLKSWFKSLGIIKVVEMDWWDQYEASGLNIIAVPVHHWSQRTPFSKNRTLWAGWAIQSTNFRFFFCGDSGYTPIFKEIGAQLGPFDLSAIPIGAYEPQWFMRYHHISPEEALQVHLDIRSRKSVAIHWGTFVLTDEPLDEPPQRLKKALDEKGLSREVFLALMHGETITLE